MLALTVQTVQWDSGGWGSVSIFVLCDVMSVQPTITKNLRRLHAHALRRELDGGLRVRCALPCAPLRMAYKKELVGDFVRGSLHGGSAAGLMDTCGGIAAWSVLPDLTWRVGAWCMVH